MKIFIPFFLLMMPILMSDLNGQVKHDISIDLFNPVIERTFGTLFYEFSIKEDVGLENALQLDRNGRSVWPDTISNVNEVMEFDRYDLSLVTNVKWYFSKKDNNEGFYIGPTNRLQLNVWKEDGYEAAFLERYGVEPGEEDAFTWALGANIGYKFMLKERIILEGMLKGDLSLLNLNEVIDLNSFLYLRVGYRLSK